jgi:hypothetical protein
MVLIIMRLCCPERYKMLTDLTTFKTVIGNDASCRVPRSQEVSCPGGCVGGGGQPYTSPY